MSKQGDITRKRIIDTVVELLKVKGYNGIGLLEIIKESGTPKGSLYFHFPGGKNEIVETAIKQFGENNEKLLRKVLQGSPDLANGIQIIFSQLIAELESSNFEKGCPVTATVMDPVNITDSILSSCAHCFQKIRNVIVEMLKKKGLDEKDAYDQAMFIQSSFEGALVLAKAYKSSEPLKIVQKELIRLFT